ncbi:betaine aldehyde dehydrogenase [Magnaporthiopsis poae ATCC 64411]|uniref:aldehyde dehydrogenase (NAD(+)) n=1 Tax=Magnaporthiopsis poae (strain ATCC 64411 / 73-15) TaxID=644358 RepID=A0A0C4EAF6_MAGP6|nr:betaine aldehyde dehydrogenase [Magnaporthiopsis poae ATCC 64411]
MNRPVNLPLGSKGCAFCSGNYLSQPDTRQEGDQTSSGHKQKKKNFYLTPRKRSTTPFKMGSISQSPAFFNIINGERRSGTKFDHGIDPRTEKPLWDVPVASAADLDDAVTAARNAFPGWANKPLAERKKALARMAEVLNENTAELIEVIMRETGKSQLMASIEIQNTAAQCLFYSKTALEDELQYEDETVRIMATYPPLGVVGAICPWNFPLILSTIKVVAALVMGNCIIIKASPFTPYSALKFAEIVQGARCVPTRSRRQRRRHRVPGRRRRAATAGQVAAGAYFNAGQVCVATKRVYVHEDIYPAFVEAFVAETGRTYAPVVAADAETATPTVFGPVANKMQFDKVKGLLQDVKKAGGEVLTGGAAHDGPGYWIQPTVVAQPPEDSRLVQEEQFGPVVPIMKWSSEDDVIKRANLTNSGLGATVYSKDLQRAESIARRLECGSVWINMPERPREAAWMGGWKDSGYGGEMGKLGLYAYCHVKSIHYAK